MDELNYVIATLRENDNIVGYKVFAVDALRVHNLNMTQTEKLCASYGGNLFVNAKWDSKYKGLVSVCDKSIASLPKINSQGCVEGKRGIGIAGRIIDADNELVGYIVFDSMGMRANVSIEKFDSLRRKLEPINFKMGVDNNGNLVPRPLCGEKWKVVKMSEYKKSHYRSGLGQDAVDPTDIPVVPIYSLNEVKDTEFNTTAQKKIFEAITGLKQMCPYYWVLLQTIDKRPCGDSITKTMCVTEDTLYYNIEHVASISVPELRFIFIHEVDHIAMQHAIRKGKNRDHKKWNYACDLYINENIMDEFNLQIGVVSTIGGVEIMPPDWILYVGRHGMSLDLSRDLPEVIYERLGEESNSEGSDEGNQDGPSGGNSSDSSGSNGGSQSDSSDSSEGSSDGSDDSDVSEGEASGSSDDIFGDLDENGNKVEKSETTVTYNGKKLDGRCIDEIKSNTGQKTEEDLDKSIEQSKQKIQQMDTKKKMVEQKLGKELDKSTLGTQLVQRFIEFGLSSTVDWRVVLKNMCKFKPKKQYTLAHPNQDYMNMGVTIAGRRKISKDKELSRIKICIDVSGSVSQDQLNWYLSEVANIFNHFKVSGELIYWSTNVGDSGDFNKIKDLVKIQPKSTGGTDVSCVFEYLTGGRKTATGKKEETKVKDIIGVIIVTDGMFNDNYAQYESAFGKKTLWLIDNNINFNPLFGQVMSLGSKRD